MQQQITLMVLDAGLPRQVASGSASRARVSASMRPCVVCNRKLSDPAASPACMALT